MDEVYKNLGFCLKRAKDLSSYKGGGSAYTVYPSTEDELKAALSVCGATVIGGGSNILIADGIARTPLVSLKRFDCVEFDGNSVFAGAGVRVATLARIAAQRNLGGLEFLAGVPATVGGAVHMNAGAFDHSIGELTRFVYAVEGGFVAEDIEFGYRQGFRGTAIGVELELVPRATDEIEKLIKFYLASRAAKQPKLPSLGSVFKNGVAHAGKLIDECGLKGAKAGGAQISQKHANFIVNTGGGSANDYLTLATLCEEAVLEKFGVRLEREFIYVQ